MPVKIREKRGWEPNTCCRVLLAKFRTDKCTDRTRVGKEGCGGIKNTVYGRLHAVRGGFKLGQGGQGCSVSLSKHDTGDATCWGRPKRRTAPRLPKLPGHVSSAHKHVFCFERVSSTRPLTRVVEPSQQ